MLKDARHLPRSRRHTGDGHYGLPIDFQNLVRTIVDHGVTRSRTAVSRNQNAAGKFERKDRCPLGRLRCLLLCRVVRHRTDRTKGCLTRDGMLAMIFKLGLCAERSWRRLRGFEWLAKVVAGVKFRDGIEVQNVMRINRKYQPGRIAA